MINISSKMLVKSSNNSYLEQIEIPKTNIISKLETYFINHNSSFCKLSNENPSNKPIPILKLPIIMSYLEAERLGHLILRNASTETKILKFTIPASFLDHQPGDFIICIIIINENCLYKIRVVDSRNPLHH